MVMNVLRLVLAVNSVSKALNLVEKILICVVVNSNQRVSLFTRIVTQKFWCENVFGRVIQN